MPVPVPRRRSAPGARALPLLAAFVAGCVLAPRDEEDFMVVGRSTAQGFLGVTMFEDLDLDLDAEGVEVLDVDEPTLPLVGGVIQRPLNEGRVEVGIEGGLSFGWGDDDVLLAIDGGSTQVLGEHEIFLGDLFIGPFVRAPLGRRLALYGGVGPLLQYGDVELEYRDPTDGRVSMDDDGVGLGWYARGGIEFALDPYTWIGLGARWVDSELALGGGFDDYELDALQLVLTMSTGL